MALSLDDLSTGDRVYRWWDSGALGAEVQPLTVIRVNRVTVTVETDHGGRFRLPASDIAGRMTPDMEPTARCGQQTGESHPCARPADGHTRHRCALGDCQWGPYSADPVR